MTFRIALALIWCAVIAVFTSTFNLELLLQHRIVLFIFNPHPNLGDFFVMSDLRKIHPDWVTVKIGHFIAFGIMNLLLYNVFRKNAYAIAGSLLFAFATEWIQLYFNRDGRFYDIIIDLCGIVTAYVIIGMYQFVRSRTASGLSS
ncbi:VanZ family protein [Paenibacillus chartarius]|uniref:VanZ family protein n=1 Tax=Paenibacillus chartarius TaxID=747481 RepID=A0ABV6DKP5_9BACL